ncbi:YchJ family metal-binding protein, partial [Nocardia neocaledoniensis]|uniref:YchJ family metal-binding protein n=1 Tax=Nocardia neocaledoniensis TaxID=236511 RepID=UPI002456AAD6
GTQRGGPFDDNGTVEFIAHYKLDGVRDAMHELSTFVRVDGAWAAWLRYGSRTIEPVVLRAARSLWAWAASASG